MHPPVRGAVDVEAEEWWARLLDFLGYHFHALPVCVGGRHWPEKGIRTNTSCVGSGFRHPTSVEATFGNRTQGARSIEEGEHKAAIGSLSWDNRMPGARPYW